MTLFGLPEHFWAKVIKGPGCWQWTAAVNSSGYGSFWREGKCRTPHRLVYEAVHGAIEDSDGFRGACVCHHCDNPLCVNPDHLFLGSGWDNQNDKVQKGRHARGTTTNRAVLTEQDVREIRAAAGTNAAVADSFGVSPSTVSYIRNRRSWRHVV